MSIYLRVIGLFLVLTSTAYAGDGYLYKVKLLRAAPGGLPDLIEQMWTGSDKLDSSAGEGPWWMRHSQGDHWDLMLIIPVGRYESFYAGEKQDRRRAFEELELALMPFVTWQEDVFMYGDAPSTFGAAFGSNSFFHVEMFQALPGKRDALLEERAMENVYLNALGRPQNFVFVKDQGAAWDVMTIGCYRDLKHFAGSADIPAGEEEIAAKTAGFESAGSIGFYLRTLIARHNDTLGVRPKK